MQGRLTNEGYFLANKVIAKCPSKYEMQERQKSGEKMPHAVAGAAATRELKARPDA